jgi:outer membrane protein OmpA-like peptidoglycan-associated protein
MRKSTHLFIFSFLISLSATAQFNFGIATSNWSGTNSLMLNPANAADDRAKFVIDIAALGFDVDNNLGSINSASVLKRFYKGQDVNINDVFSFSSNKDFSMMAPAAEVKGPGLMYRINQNNTVALTTDIRAFNQFNNFDQTLYRTITDPNFNNGNYSFSSQKFNWTAQMWSEVNLTYGIVLLNKGKSELKAGITARYLGGIAYVSAKGNNLDADYYGTKDSLYVNHSDVEYASNVISTQNQLSNGIGNADLLSRFFGAKGGSGVGGDIGLVYDFRPDYPNNYKYDMDGQTGIIDYGQNMYKLRISVALTDVGYINYRSSNNFTANVSGNGTLTGDGISNNVNNFNEFRSYAMSQGFSVDTGRNSTKVYMPTALVAGVDYHIAHSFYVNATYVINVANRQDYGNSYYNQLTVTPRYDIRQFSIGLPITYGTLANDLKVGLGIRVAGFFIGSDDVLAAFGNGQHGFDFYLGGFVPINIRKPRDRDNDQVSDKKDLCPNVKGVWAYHGCPDPDTDHDGVPDSVDKCPTVPGSPTAYGCPDRDLDSVADEQDRCPDQAGPVALQGCPDRDHDGIADVDDSCPDVAGPAKFHGCPDTDGDGIPDNQDLCPDKPGPLAFHGCPDTDGDGIPDNLDKCPTVPGPASNQGCPEVKDEVRKRLAFAATAIQFQTGKAIIKKTSYPLLNEIVKILNDYPDYYMTIDGQTDNVGKPAMNMVLSKDRADAVKNYFVSQGIKSDRIVTAGHGDTQPVASNKTAAGRAKNRRVDMDLKLISNK